MIRLVIITNLDLSNSHDRPSSIHLGDRVTLMNSTAIMVIKHFSRQNDDAWHATVRFACDPLRTTMSFPVSLLQPIPATERTIQ